MSKQPSFADKLAGRTEEEIEDGLAKDIYTEQHAKLAHAELERRRRNREETYRATEVDAMQEANRLARESVERMREANEIADRAREDAAKSHRSSIASAIAALISAVAAVAAILIPLLTRK